MSIIPFAFNGSDVRVVMQNEQPWWVAKDVCDVLGISKYHQAVYGNPSQSGNGGLDEDERGTYNVDTPGGQQEMLMVNESGLYSLILRSRKPEAKAFKRWITHEVIPSIRQTGSYTSQPAFILPQTYSEALFALASKVKESEEQALVIQEMAPKAEFHDKVSNAVESMTVNDAAKALGTGETRLWNWLKSQKIVFKEGQNNVPYQTYIERGLFKVVKKTWTDGNGEDHIYSKTLVTGKGLIWLQSKLGEVA